MKKSILFLFFVLISLSIQSQTEKKVLILGIDGCRSDALAAANTPNLDQLSAQGVFSPDALNDDITISGPGWSAMLCGVWSDKHLVTGNNFEGNDYVSYPSIFKRIEEFNPDLHTVSFVHWNPINDWIVGEDADFKLNLDSDLEVEEVTSNYLLANDPDILFLHFDDVDHAGHANGFSMDVPEYISAIEDVDGHIGEVISALQSRPNYENEDWLVLVSTDHGGNGFSHGGNTIGEERVFIMASGSNIPDEIILKETTTVDPPFNCLESTTELTFDGAGDYVEVEANALFDFADNQDFTIECRVRTSTAADVAIIGNKDWDSGANPGFVFSFRYASGPEWKVNIGDGSNRVDLETGGEIADNEWHTLSVSFDRDGLMKMYEDGVEVGSADISEIGNINTNQGLYFGSDFLGSYSYEGAIAEVRTWNTVLSDEEIGEWACAEISEEHTSYDNLIGYWKMKEGEGNTVTDFSPNGNNGNIINATWQDINALVVDDYSNTPRTTDIAITALTHLCVPILEEWNLDGNSLIEECMSSNIVSNEVLSFDFKLSPNPTNNILNVEVLSNSFGDTYGYQITNLKSEVLKKGRFDNSVNRVDLNELAKGIYFIILEKEEERLTKKFVIE